MFERQYMLVSIRWTDREHMTEMLNDVVAANDSERAAASIACMSAGGDHMHFLIEKWRDVGDRQQDPAGAVDATAAVRKPRRKRSSQNHDTRTASGVEPESVTLPLE